MPQADKKELKTIIQSKKEIRDLSAEIAKNEKMQAEYLETTGEEAKEINLSLAEQRAKHKELLKDYKKNYKEAKKGTGALIEGAEEWGKTLSNKVGKAMKDAEKKGKKLGDRFEIQSATITAIGVDLNKSLNDGNEKSVELIEKLSGVNLEIEQMAKGITEFSDDKMAELNEQAADYLESLEDQGKVTGENLDMMKDLVAANKKNAKGVSAASIKGGEFAKHITTAEGRANLLAVAISAVGAGMEKVAETAEAMQKNLGTSTEHTMKMAFGWKKFGLAMFGLNAGLSGARQDIALAASDITMMNDDAKYLAQNFAWMARATGASTQTLAEMQEILMLNTDLTRDSANQMVLGMEEFVRSAGGIPKEVFDDIASSAEEIAKFTDGSADAIARAATMANKLGINLKTAGSAADSLLNLESSIASEFEASVLIGRELNLDKARQLALSNDLEGVMKEIVAQVGSEQEFLAMNAIERQALAEAVGMSTEDLSKMIGYGAGGGGEVDPALKLQKKGNKTLKDILFQLTPGGLKWLISGLTKALVGLLGFKAMKAGIIAGLKAAGMDATAFMGGIGKGIKDSLGITKMSAYFNDSSKMFSKNGKIATKIAGYLSKIKLGFAKYAAKVSSFFKGPFGKVFGKLAVWIGVAIDLFRGASKFMGWGSDKTGEERKTEKRQGAGILIGGIIGGALGAIGGPVGLGIGAGIGAWIGEKMATMEMPPGFAQAFKNWFAGVWGAVKPLVDRITALFSKFSDIFAGEGEMSEKIGKALGELLIALPGIIFDIGTSVVGLFVSGFMLLWDIIPKINAFLGEIVDSMITSVWEATKDMGNAVWEGLKSGLAGIGTAMMNFGSALFSTIKNGIFSGINNIIMSMRDFEIFNYAPFKDMELIAIDEAASSKKANDFIWRPDSGIQTFSGDDTLLGLKDMAKLSQIGSDKEAMSLQIAELRAIKEGLAPLMNIAMTNKEVSDKLNNLALAPTIQGD